MMQDKPGAIVFLERIGDQPTAASSQPMRSSPFIGIGEIVSKGNKNMDAKMHWFEVYITHIDGGTESIASFDTYKDAKEFADLEPGARVDCWTCTPGQNDNAQCSKHLGAI